MQDISSVIRDIRLGNEAERESFITSRRVFIHKYASFVCKKQLDWSNDDELSIALLAFNGAIDTFDGAAGKSFINYARLLMRNSLIDYFRKQSRLKAAHLEREATVSDAEAEVSWQRYRQELEQRERTYDIKRFREEIAGFDLSLDDLVGSSPRHADTREALKRVARQVAVEESLVEKIYRQKRLPLKEIEALTGVKKKLLEQWRRYILSMVIILTRDELVNLAEYIKGRGEEDAKS